MSVTKSTSEDGCPFRKKSKLVRPGWCWTESSRPSQWGMPSSNCRETPIANSFWFLSWGFMRWPVTPNFSAVSLALILTLRKKESDGLKRKCVGTILVTLAFHVKLARVRVRASVRDRVPSKPTMLTYKRMLNYITETSQMFSYKLHGVSTLLWR